LSFFLSFICVFEFSLSSIVYLYHLLIHSFAYTSPFQFHESFFLFFNSLFDIFLFISFVNYHIIVLGVHYDIYKSSYNIS
jgi:hypothetical protein